LAGCKVVESEESLVEAAQNGHLQSFGALYERYYGSMVALAYSVLGDVHMSEDAAQEVFAIACRDLPRLKSKDKFAAWLGGICRNVARQMSRCKGEAVALNVQVPAKNSEDDYRDVVRGAVWRLRGAYRETIVMRYYDNMPYERIAAVLGISPQAVHGRLTRAKRKIADYLRGSHFANFGKMGPKRNGFKGGDYERR